MLFVDTHALMESCALAFRNGLSKADGIMHVGIMWACLSERVKKGRWDHECRL